MELIKITEYKELTIIMQEGADGADNKKELKRNRQLGAKEKDLRRGLERTN